MYNKIDNVLTQIYVSFYLYFANNKWFYFLIREVRV